jgi:ATP-dependent RNA helicase SUPV3L1/SUV3
VYRIAELLRRFRGGAAVVMGALSPRTRNAQVALYQAGEVDYLVATDAIGMGLNLNVDHVAFAGVSKFDGREARELTAPEIAQIAGRAGRHMRDGSFGTTLDVGTLDAGVVDAVENHSFEPLDRIFWRNARLDLSSVAALLHSLEAPPPAPALVRQREAEDLLSLRALAQMPDIAALAHAYDAVSLLWEVCRIPDFRKTMADQHVRLLAAIYRHLMGPASRLPEAWVGRMVDRLDRSDGDIDTLATRIAHIRTWNYVAYRGDWVADPAALQERTRGIEDALSDALHDRLTQRFVDRRTALLARQLERKETLVAAVRKSGEVVVEGEYVGTLTGFDFLPDDAAAWRDGRALRTAVRQALEPEMRKRAGALVAAANDAFALDAEGTVLWQGAPVARLVRGADALAPALRSLGGQVPEALRRRIEKRLAAWLRGHLAEALAPLMRAREAALEGAARGLVFQLAEGLGSVPRAAVSEQLAALTPADRKALARLGVRLGRETVFVAAMLKPRPIAVRALLWCVHEGEAPRPSPSARVSLPVDHGVPEGFYAATGYRPLGARALRVDMLERLAAALRRRARSGPFAPDAALFNLAGCTGEAFDGVVRALGYRPRRAGEDGQVLYAAPLRQRQRPRAATRARPGARESASPFAALAPLKRARK